MATIKENRQKYSKWGTVFKEEQIKRLVKKHNATNFKDFDYGANVFQRAADAIEMQKMYDASMDAMPHHRLQVVKQTIHDRYKARKMPASHSEMCEASLTESHRTRKIIEFRERNRELYKKLRKVYM